jgi:hypothetical protein
MWSAFLSLEGGAASWTRPAHDVTRHPEGLFRLLNKLQIRQAPGPTLFQIKRLPGT